MSSDREVVSAAYDELDAAFDKVLELSFDALTPMEKLTLQNRMGTQPAPCPHGGASADQLTGRRG